MLKLLFIMTAAIVASVQGFRVQGNKVIGPNNQECMFRGINLQYGDNPGNSFRAFDALRHTGANILRVQFRTFNSASDVERALDAAIVQYNMPVMAMLWDEGVTCTNNVDLFAKSVNWWLRSDIQNVVKKSKYQGKIVVNIANEFSLLVNDNQGRSMSRKYFRDLYLWAIQSLRSNGYKMPLVIDGYHCAQSPDSFSSVVDGEMIGTTLMKKDPLKSLIFSLHAYSWLWDSDQELANNFQLMTKAPWPVILGEHGSKNDGGINLGYMQQLAQYYRIGTIAWSWYGNGPGAEGLNMNNGYSPVSLTNYGNAVMWSQYGIGKTSRSCV